MTTSARSILPHPGGLGYGRLECDGQQHVWVVEEWQKYNCRHETPVGPCYCHLPPASPSHAPAAPPPAPAEAGS